MSGRTQRSDRAYCPWLLEACFRLSHVAFITFLHRNRNVIFTGDSMNTQVFKAAVRTSPMLHCSLMHPQLTSVLFLPRVLARNAFLVVPESSHT